MTYAYVRLKPGSIGYCRRGLSLMEVVLALAILAVASAYLAQSMHMAVENALRSERRTQAEVIAESVMNQIVAGILPTSSVPWTPYSNPNAMGSPLTMTSSSQWMYSVSNVETEVQGMIGLQVAVMEALEGRAQVADFYINRWIIDPNLGLDTPPTEEETAETGTGSASTSGTSTGGSSTGGLQ
jgi:prepilin-type N-terminal cleavage/methylation domain-containing protein